MPYRPTLLIAILAILLAAPAWAVVVSFEATDDSGRPLPGATIQIGDATGVTGGEGIAPIDVSAEPGDRIDVVVVYDERVVFDGSVEVSTDGTVVLATSVPATIFKDGFESGNTSSWLDASVTGRVSTERVEPQLESQIFEIVTRFGGAVVPEESQSGSLSPSELEEARRTERKRHEIPTSFGVRLDFPLRAFGRGSRESRLPAGAGGILAAADARSRVRFARTTGSGGASERSDGWRFYPTLSLGAGQADVEFQSVALADDTRTTFSGDGQLLGAGIRGVLFPCSDCRWFLTLGYDHARTDDIEMSRNPGLQAFVPDGILVAEDRVEYRARSSAASVTVGRALRRAAPWVGVRAVQWRGELDVDLLLQADGLPAEQSQSARNQFEEDLVEAVVGADVRSPGSRLVLRIEGSTDGDNYSLAFGVGAAFGR
jgi:hypothetical protein